MQRPASWPNNAAAAGAVDLAAGPRRAGSAGSRPTPRCAPRWADLEAAVLAGELTPALAARQVLAAFLADRDPD